MPLRITRRCLGSLWKAEMIQSRREWARKRNPKLDRRAGPLEIFPGVTWRAAMKMSMFIIGLAAIIAWSNNKAYDKIRTERAFTGSMIKHERDTKKILATSDQASEAEFITTRERISNMMEQIKKETNDWDTSKIKNVSIARPQEGLTVDNLREAAMGYTPAPSRSAAALDAQIQKHRDAMQKSE